MVSYRLREAELVFIATHSDSGDMMTVSKKAQRARWSSNRFRIVLELVLTVLPHPFPTDWFPEWFSGIFTIQALNRQSTYQFGDLIVILMFARHLFFGAPHVIWGPYCHLDVCKAYIILYRQQRPTKEQKRLTTQAYIYIIFVHIVVLSRFLFIYMYSYNHIYRMLMFARHRTYVSIINILVYIYVLI